MSAEVLTKKSGHLAWCAMVALQLAKQEGQFNSELQENIFIIRWLSTALKQHRFPREVAPDIEWLLKQGRLLGTRAKLRYKLNYLWQSCTSELSEQNDLFRLTYALETAKQMHWIYCLLTDKEWTGRNAIALNTNVNGIFVARSSLDAAFDDNGQQILPLMAKVTGNVEGLKKLLDHCDWQLDVNPNDTMLFQLMTSKYVQRV